MVVVVVMPVKKILFYLGGTRGGEGQPGRSLDSQMGTFVNGKVWMYRGERTGKF